MDGNKTTLLISIFSPFDLRHTKKRIWRFWYFHVVVSVSVTFEGEVRLTTKERSKPVIFHVKGPKHKIIFLLCYLSTSMTCVFDIVHTRHTKELRAVTLSAKTNGTFKKLWFFYSVTFLVFIFLHWFLVQFVLFQLIKLVPLQQQRFSSFQYRNTVSNASTHEDWIKGIPILFILKSTVKVLFPAN